MWVGGQFTQVSGNAQFFIARFTDLPDLRLREHRRRPEHRAADDVEHTGAREASSMETLGSLELARLLLALTLLLAFAHIAGYLATRVRQPRVIGEIVGGLLLGPTVLGAIAPACTIRCSPPGPVPVVLDAMYQLGLLLLMFSAGSRYAPRSRPTNAGRSRP